MKVHPQGYHTHPEYKTLSTQNSHHFKTPKTIYCTLYLRWQSNHKLLTSHHTGHGMIRFLRPAGRLRVTGARALAAEAAGETLPALRQSVGRIGWSGKRQRDRLDFPRTGIWSWGVFFFPGGEGLCCVFLVKSHVVLWLGIVEKIFQWVWPEFLSCFWVWKLSRHRRFVFDSYYQCLPERGTCTSCKSWRFHRPNRCELASCASFEHGLLSFPIGDWHWDIDLCGAIGCPVYLLKNQYA